MSIKRYIFHNICHNDDDKFLDMLKISNFKNYLKIIEIDISGSASKPSRVIKCTKIM